MQFGEAQDSGRTFPPATRRAVGSSAKEQMERELNSLKLQANLAQQSRIQASVGMWSIMMPFELITQPAAVAKAFATKHKGQSKHNFGSPHVQVWRAMLVSIIKACEELEPETKTKIESSMEILKEELKQFELAGPQRGHEFIRQCRVKQCKDESQGLLHYCLSHLRPNMRETDIAMHSALQTLQATILPGTAPPSELERKVQKDIEAIQAILGKK
jgi:hypothetical protein